MGVVILAVDLGKTFCRAAAGGRRAEGVGAPALSMSVMIALGKAYGPRMVDVRATNAKLRRRTVRERVRDALGGT
jgi:N-acetylmuramic acid 6-phosphate (MurNAc-6-P) etherase